MIVGKIILDLYGDPALVAVAGDDGDDDDDGDAEDCARGTRRGGRGGATTTIGGGGPQAAWGACASLAARDAFRRRKDGGLLSPSPPRRDCDDDDDNDDEASTTPPRQDVTFLAPVGLENWTPSMTESLGFMLPMLRTPPILVTSDDHVTPTIRIWHDEYENFTWDPVDDSFGMGGADGLWRVGPSARDILDAVDGSRARCDGDGEDDMIVLHAILEAGACSAGGGMDASPFFDAHLMRRVVVASVEPIAFPDVDDAGAVSHEDARAMYSLVDGIEASLTASSSYETKTNGGGRRRKLLIISPDRPCHDALVSCRAGAGHSRRPPLGDDERDDDDDDGAPRRGRTPIEYAIRDGARGSVVSDGVSIPSASPLATPDGMPVDPTGAGNAYAGAYAACRGTGSTVEEAACLASAVGAVVCEYENLPPWTWGVLGRVVEAACEVREKMMIRGPS